MSKSKDNTTPSMFKILPGATKVTKNSGEPWAREEVKDLRACAHLKMSVRLIGIRLGRTEASIRSKFLREGITVRQGVASPVGLASNFARDH